MCGAAVPAEVGRYHFEVRTKRCGELRPLSARVTGTMQKHDRLPSADGGVLTTDAPDVDAGDAHILLPGFIRRPEWTLVKPLRVRA